jgi:hypothetical protein
MTDLIDEIHEAFDRREAARAEAAARQAAWDSNMIDLSDEWYGKLDRLAKAEGWAIFTVDNADGTFLQLQAIDDPDDGNTYLTGGDGEMYALVARRAAEGSKPHILALYLDNKHADAVSVPKSLLEW